jgi:hypothetical protein
MTASDRVGRRRSKEERDRDRIELRARHSEAKRQADEAREARRREESARKDQARLDLERAVDAAYDNYQRVREWAVRARSEGAARPLTETERAIDAALEPLWHADRATIAGLRRWSEPLAGAPAPADTNPSPDVVERLRRKVTLLRKWQLGDLLVPDTTTLGKAGFMVSDELHSEATITFAMATAALSDGAVLPAFRAPSTRRVVWDIGGGWGGFAYHFKRLCPEVTYLITGSPARLLVAATYLMSVYPGARCRLHGEAGHDSWAGWEQLDFVFATDASAAGLRPPRLDLTVDIDELRAMAPEQQEAHVRRAHEWGSAYFYSMVPAVAAEAPETPWPLLERWFWTHPIAVRTARSGAYSRIAPPEHDAAHLVGWRRMRTSTFAEAPVDK